MRVLPNSITVFQTMLQVMFQAMSLAPFSAVFLMLLLTSSYSYGANKNGFDLAGASVPVNLIREGGPPKDGIPAIDQPKFASSLNSAWLNPKDRILGVSLNGVAKAYPIAILNWHELVNDSIGDISYVVSFCPLCGTGMVFNAQVGDTARTFGVSGLLFESDVLLYDRQTDSLWSQIWMKSISGQNLGQTLTPIAVDHTSWSDWQTRHPDTLVLSRETGFERDYGRNPYQGYELRDSSYFPIENTNDAFHSKSWVLGVALNGETKAYPFSEMANRKSPFVDEFAGESLKVEFDSEHQTVKVWLGDQRLPAVQAYWFAWYAFYPETQVLLGE